MVGFQVAGILGVGARRGAAVRLLSAAAAVLLLADDGRWEVNLVQTPDDLIEEAVD